MGYGISETADVMGRMIQKLDHVSTNLANASTAGYKAEHLYASGQGALPSESSGEVTLPPAIVSIDFSRGLAQRTGNDLDVMIENEGFFVVQTKSGVAYTRRGDFTLNRDGMLVTQSGDAVMGETGPITIKGQRVSISKEGTVKVDDSEAGKLKLVSFADKGQLKKTENGYYTSEAEPQKVDKPEVAQGMVELSNVNVIREMVDMIDIQRSFEVYQKIIQTISDQDKTATSRVGRLA